MANSDPGADLQPWIGRSETRDDILTAAPPAALHATLDHDLAAPAPGDALPPLWHWLYFLPRQRQSEIGADGHARRGGFLPPVPLPRRMWAGGRLEFAAPLRIGEPAQRRSTIEDVVSKQGRSGALVFVTVRHDIFVHGADQPALREWHDIVYREERARESAAPAATAPADLPAQAEWQRVLVPDEVLLFRYSALTFNGHRIHYDRRYVTEVEGYPGLVVHGPLIATLLLDLLQRHRPAAVVKRFSFKALNPCFDGRPLHLNGAAQDDGRVRLWAQDDQGRLAMDAQAQTKLERP